MSGGKIRKLVVFAAIAAVVAAVVRALRGEPTPVYSNHPSVTGGVPTPEPVVETKPTVETKATIETLPAAEPEVAQPEVEVVAEPVVESAPAAPAAEVAWVLPVDRECPAGFPVKVKVRSGIFHAPGSPTYERTKPDRCYATVEAAEADGLRAPKR